MPDAAQPTAAERLRGRLLILAAAVLWSTNGVFAKSTLFDDWPLETRGLTMAFWRALFAALVVAPFVRQVRWSGWLVAIGGLFALLSVTFLTSLTQTTAANAVWLQSAAPLWVLLLGTLVFREPATRADLGPLGVLAVGVGLILWFELRGSAAVSGAPLGVVLGVASGVMYATVLLLLRRLRALDPAWLVVVIQGTTALVVAPYALGLGPWPTTPQLLTLAAFGVVQLGIPYLLFARGLRTVSSHEGAALSLVEPILVPVWVYAVWGERTAWWTIAGAALILVGLGLRYLRAAPSAAENPAAGGGTSPPGGG